MEINGLAIENGRLLLSPKFNVLSLEIVKSDLNKIIQELATNIDKLPTSDTCELSDQDQAIMTEVEKKWRKFKRYKMTPSECEAYHMIYLGEMSRYHFYISKFAGMLMLFCTGERSVQCNVFNEKGIMDATAEEVAADLIMYLIQNNK